MLEGLCVLRADEFHIDILCAHLVQRSQHIDVVVASKLFGDLDLDLDLDLRHRHRHRHRAIAIAPSANLNPTREWPSLFDRARCRYGGHRGRTGRLRRAEDAGAGLHMHHVPSSARRLPKLRPGYWRVDQPFAAQHGVDCLKDVRRQLVLPQQLAPARGISLLCKPIAQSLQPAAAYWQLALVGEFNPAAAATCTAQRFHEGQVHDPCAVATHEARWQQRQQAL